MLCADKLKDKITSYVYKISKQPVTFRDLLTANALYNEGMYVDPSKLNFRMDITKAYIAYALLAAAVLIPLLAITHTIFTNLDFHISIIGTIFATASVFVGFYFFKHCIRDRITLQLIKEAWKIHFPYFPYDKYSKIIEDIYNDALKKDIPKKELERYVLDKLSQS
jgi:hypothetical protein